MSKPIHSFPEVIFKAFIDHIDFALLPRLSLLLVFPVYPLLIDLLLSWPKVSRLCRGAFSRLALDLLLVDLVPQLFEESQVLAALLYLSCSGLHRVCCVYVEQNVPLLLWVVNHSHESRIF